METRDTIKTEEKNAVGVSLSCFLPWIMSKKYRGEIVKKLKSEGVDFVTALPFRGARLGQTLLPVRYIEKAWNPTKRGFPLSAIEIFKGEAGFRFAPRLHKLLGWPGEQAVRNCYTSSRLQDLLFFPSKKKAENRYQNFKEDYPDTTPVVTDFNEADQEESCLLTISPRLMMRPEEIIAKMEQNPKIAGLNTDLLHINPDAARGDIFKFEMAKMGMPFDTKPKFGDPKETLKTLLSKTKLLDIHPESPEEVMRFLGGERTQLQELIEYTLLDQGYEEDMRIELNMGGKMHILKPGQVYSTVCRARDRLAEIIE